MTTDSAVSFRMHASTVPGCAAAISGELVLDATGLTFIDRRRLTQLLSWDNVRIEPAP